MTPDIIPIPAPVVRLQDLRICIKGAGDLATGVAARLHRSGFTRILMLETAAPLAVRRAVSFSEAVYGGEKIVEGLLAVLTHDLSQVHKAWAAGRIAVMVDPRWEVLRQNHFDVVIDAIVAKRNLGTHPSEAPLVIGLGPGFTAGVDVHRVVETHRGHTMGRVIRHGRAIANTGIPGAVQGYGRERVLRAPQEGVFTTSFDIGNIVKKGDAVGAVGGMPVTADLDGLIRGLLRGGTAVRPGTKLGDIDPRKEIPNCNLVSDKANALGGGVLEAILETFMGTCK